MEKKIVFKILSNVVFHVISDFSSSDLNTTSWTESMTDNFFIMIYYMSDSSCRLLSRKKQKGPDHENACQLLG